MRCDIASMNIGPTLLCIHLCHISVRLPQLLLFHQFSNWIPVVTPETYVENMHSFIDADPINCRRLYIFRFKTFFMHLIIFSLTFYETFY